MKFIEPNLEVILRLLDQLEENTNPEWGTMTPVMMVEHLTTMLKMASGKFQPAKAADFNKTERPSDFLTSAIPLQKNLKASFVPEFIEVKNENLSDAIDEFTEEWLAYEEHYQNDSSALEEHPYLGLLNYQQWQQLHSKHISHHLLQFGLITA
jgi:oxepin-CoA hydrolase/3-oxo-5,6-dehydrosuberyl-CoA semialdehyde dehydrogenase